MQSRGVLYPCNEALFQSLARHYARALLPPSALHGAKAKAQEILGVGAWGKGVPRLGGLSTPSPFPQYKRLFYNASSNTTLGLAITLVAISEPQCR